MPMSVAAARAQIVAQVIDGPDNSITPSKMRQVLVDLLDALDASISVGTTIPVAGGGTGATTAAAARLNLGIDQETPRGDANYTILATDRVVATSAAFTAARVWTLPAASAVNAGQSILVVDGAGGVTVTNTLTVQRAGSDTINGGTSVLINASRGAYLFVSNGSNAWAAIVLGQQAALGVASFNGRTGAVSPANDDYAATQLAAIAANSILGNNTGASARPIVLSVTDVRTLLGLGTAALLAVGTGANNIVQLDSSSRLPAVDGSQLTNMPGSISRQVFNTSGTWTKPASGTLAMIECWGGGGSGGKQFGSGGGGGGYSRLLLPLSALSSTVPVTVGAGGAAKATNGYGNIGGTTTFGSYASAYGGGNGGGAPTNGSSSGGGGGGSLSAGATNANPTGGAGGLPAGTNEGKGGDVGFAGNPGFFIGGGGGAGNYAGGYSAFGGGGGGGGGNAPAAGGASGAGGAGGAGGSSSSGTDGTQPGGGGGGTSTGAQSGKGGDGGVIVTVW